MILLYDRKISMTLFHLKSMKTPVPFTFHRIIKSMANNTLLFLNLRGYYMEMAVMARDICIPLPSGID